MSSVTPPRMGLHPVVEPAQPREVVGVGLVGWSAVVEGDVLVDVVGVEPSLPVAPGEAAAVVAVLDDVSEPVGDLVGVHRDVLGQVDDGGELDGRAGREAGFTVR